MSFLDRFKRKQDRARLAEHARKRSGSAVPVSSAPSASSEMTAARPMQQRAPGVAASDAHRILVRPYVTEKLTSAKGKNLFAFVVAQRANKPQVLRAVAARYGVTPVGIRMQRVRGKLVRYGRTKGRRPDWKKAILTLKEGETIVPEKTA